MSMSKSSVAVQSFPKMKELWAIYTWEGRIGLMFWLSNAPYASYEELTEDPVKIAEGLEARRVEDLERIAFCLSVVQEARDEIKHHTDHHPTRVKTMNRALRLALQLLHQLFQKNTRVECLQECKPYADHVLEILTDSLLEGSGKGESGLAKEVRVFFSYYPRLYLRKPFKSIDLSPAFCDAVINCRLFNLLYDKEQTFNTSPVFYRAALPSIFRALKRNALEFQQRISGEKPMFNPHCEASMVYRNTARMEGLWKKLLLNMLANGQLDDKFDFNTIE